MNGNVPVTIGSEFLFAVKPKNDYEIKMWKKTKRMRKYEITYIDSYHHSPFVIVITAENKISAIKKLLKNEGLRHGDIKKIKRII